ncbi:TetR/AcrR family transcriptional regulator [Amycolatopsis acidicola]|uniref:TetR/AcrR family transcriptional regulator n=1 Tax=Amycolatopsis acidicola TaxID=2596893 RepID=A0A5N0V4M0_9PSEU|nr:TetR/AcrR family transcriptional regulator [Amycolatopsis acidicola]KAA9160070.1 TetR/AcrR family transcriptional regulator [Amycolatopsis acidicola]
MVRAETTAPVRPSVLVHENDEPTAATLIAAAVEVMARNGYHGTSVRDIASAAGTSAAVLYHHFESKQRLLVTICDRGLDVLIHATEEAHDLAGPDPADRLRAIVGAHVAVHLDSQRESLIGNSEIRALEPAGRALIIAKRDVQQRIFDRVIRDGVRRKVFATRHPGDAARFVTSACTSVASWYHPDGPLSRDELIEHYQAIAGDAVGQRR